MTDDTWPCCGASTKTRHNPIDDLGPGLAYSRGFQLCVNVLVWHPVESGLVLLVSRKDDKTKFCFPGGKVDPADWPDGEPATRDMAQTLPDAATKACRRGAIRETREESGVLIAEEDLTRVIASSCFEDGRKNKRFAVCYMAERFSGELGTSEPIIVKWGRPREAIEGPFGDLYDRVFRKLRTPESVLRAR